MANCTVAPDEVPSDAGVAGTGVLVSFIATAYLALGLSLSLILQEQFRKNPHLHPSLVRRKLLNAYSDQQILTGIGIQVVGLVKISTMVPYHFFLIWMLSLLSMAVHNATLLALVHDFRRDWVLRWLRQFLMFVNLALSCVYGVFVLQAVRNGMTGRTLPIACVWDASLVQTGSPPPNIAASFAGTIAVIAGNVVIFALATWYLHRRTQRFYKVIQLLGLLLMMASAIGATVKVCLDSQAFGNPPIKLSDQGERVWSFGAWLSVGLLFLPVISIIEIIRGDVKCALPVEDDEGDNQGLPLMGRPTELKSFESDAFRGRNGSGTNLLKG